ncbi:DNA primase [Enterococcus sp. PF1-24]|uniref:DNA primase n=1 Tax=unclassified Enterococcus TaxID=2608891 RepID=UPI0024744E06|nr:MULTISPECIES: DNA primase [unclassified Enterococcus]MDH6364949.1 DNA primase [Enterococcus sp. PFB1-1]MDH6402050.1 DNA primase [Enterococcus sp. PF1-24]
MAQKIPAETIDEIRSKTNIVDVIGQYVQLKKSGKNHLGLCPFHEERTPSFSVAEDKQIFHCFGCGKGGNVFTFIQEIDGISFPEAVIKIAEMEQLPIDAAWKTSETSVDNPQLAKQRELIQLHEKARELFHHMLVHTKAGEEALDYLLDRGLTMELIETFQIGFAPQQREFLGKIFQNDQVQQQAMVDSGLFIQREDGSLADRFYQRIMFPVKDFQGKTIGFSGRFLQTAEFSGKDQPKYLNSPETEIFNKRNILYNFDAARPTIRKEETVFLFEGFMDVISAWQAGIKNGIASMGTSLTNEQINGIQRVSKNVVICYDGDSAGVEATQRAVQLLQQHSALKLTVVSLPEKMDPDDYRKKYGDEALKELLFHGQQTTFAFQMSYLRKNRNLQNEKEMLDYLQEVLQALVKVPSPIEQDRYLVQLAQEFQVSRESLQQQFRSLQQNVRQEERAAYYSSPEGQFQPAVATNDLTIQTQAKPLTQVEKAERMLLYRLFNEATLRGELQSQDFHFIHDEYQEIYLLMDTYLTETNQFNLADFIDFLKDEALKKVVIEIAYLELSEESTAREIQDLFHVIAKAEIAEKIAEKKRQQQEASRNGNRQLDTELQIEIFELTKQLKQA